MRIKEITMTGSRTINLGNYNSIKIEGSCTIELAEGESTVDARALALIEIKNQMNEMHNSLKPSTAK